MNLDLKTQNITLITPKNLYKWAKSFNRLQRNFFVEQCVLRREKQIEDFIRLNGFKNVFVSADTDILSSVPSVELMYQADLAVITDQKFSRLPCPAIIDVIDRIMAAVPVLYLCLNRHYINIDNSFHDQDLDDNFNVAITQWLKKNLSHHVLDLSLDYLDIGHTFTWAVPDRHYVIERRA